MKDAHCQVENSYYSFSCDCLWTTLLWTKFNCEFSELMLYGSIMPCKFASPFLFLSCRTQSKLIARKLRAVHIVPERVLHDDQSSAGSEVRCSSHRYMRLRNRDWKRAWLPVSILYRKWHWRCATYCAQNLHNGSRTDIAMGVAFFRATTDVWQATTTRTVGS